MSIPSWGPTAPVDCKCQICTWQRENTQLRSDLAQRDDQIKSLHAIVELREAELSKLKETCRSVSQLHDEEVKENQELHDKL